MFIVLKNIGEVLLAFSCSNTVLVFYKYHIATDFGMLRAEQGPGDLEQQRGCKDVEDDNPDIKSDGPETTKVRRRN